MNDLIPKTRSIIRAKLLFRLPTDVFKFVFSFSIIRYRLFPIVRRTVSGNKGQYYRLADNVPRHSILTIELNRSAVWIFSRILGIVVYCVEVDGLQKSIDNNASGFLKIIFES